MAKIVLGVGTSHTPQLSSGAENWDGHAVRDRRTKSYVGFDGYDTTFEALVEHADPKIAPQLTMDVWKEKDARAQANIATLAERVKEAAVDVMVIVGDDQRELFGPKGNPALGLYLGDELWDLGNTPAILEKIPADILLSRWATHADDPEAYPIAADLSRHLAESLVEAEFDVTVFSEQEKEHTLGHAFTFVRRRLGLPNATPIVPVFINTFYPPNVPSPGRCFALGRALRAAILAWPADIRVGFVASGGLSHTLINEELDQKVIEGLKAHDGEAIGAIPRRFFRAGNSESLNWLVVGGAMDGAEVEVIDYIPAYRSAAGTGTGMTFMTWTPQEVTV